MRPGAAAFWVGIIACAALGFLAAPVLGHQHYYFAAYLLLQDIVLSTRWDILGRPTGHVNLGLLLLAVGSVVIAGLFGRSWIGRGLRAIRGGEVAAESMGVPSLRLRLFATTVSGFVLGVAGAPYPCSVTYLDPASGFSLAYAV